MICTELKPVLSKQKSFYGKALIGESHDAVHLYSYDTNMMTIYNGKVIYMSPNPNNYTQTTLKHIKDFLYQYLGLTGLTKKDILNLRCKK